MKIRKYDNFRATEDLLKFHQHWRLQDALHSLFHSVTDLKCVTGVLLTHWFVRRVTDVFLQLLQEKGWGQIHKNLTEPKSQRETFITNSELKVWPLSFVCFFRVLTLLIFLLCVVRQKKNQRFLQPATTWNQAEPDCSRQSFASSTHS